MVSPRGQVEVVVEGLLHIFSELVAREHSLRFGLLLAFSKELFLWGL